MKPIEGLLGKTIAEITVEELAAEMAEREALYAIAPGDYNLSVEIHTLAKEICRLKLIPPIPEWPPAETLIAPGNLEAFQAGIAYGRKLTAYEKANSGHNKNRASRLFAIKQAGRVTGNYSKIRYTALREHIAAALVTMGMYCPSDGVMKKWLNDAVKERLLILPEEMPKGRGSKK